MQDRLCWVCGKPATETPTKSDNIFYSDVPETQYRAFCPRCASEYMSKRNSDKTLYLIIKTRLMIERAVRLLEHQPVNIDDYRDAILKATEYFSNHPNKADSADEILAAIGLLNEGVHFQMQAKVGKRTVDILIPGIKTVLEVDGERHANRLYYDNERDKEILKDLGDGWEIVHIKTEYIEQNVKQLYKAVTVIRSNKQLLRQQNNGEIPEGFSKKAKKPKSPRYGDELLLD